MLTNKLKEIIASKQYVSVYSNSENTLKFIFGQIVNMDESYYAIKMVSPEGREDGILIQETSNILRIEIDSQYSEKMMQLIRFNEVSIHEFRLCDSNLIDSSLLFAQKNHLIISIELVSSGYDNVVGFVLSLENEICSIQQVDEYGNNDGISSIDVKDITQISCDSSDEKVILNLWNAKAST